MNGLKDRISAAMSAAPPDWQDFVAADPGAARIIDRAIGQQYGTEWHRAVMVAWNRDMPAAIDWVAAELARARAAAVAKWQGGQA